MNSIQTTKRLAIQLSLVRLGTCVLLTASCESSRQLPADEALAEREQNAAPRGPTTVEMDADPNGLFWDDGSRTLYIADDDGNRILKWTDSKGLSSVKDLPDAPPDGPGLGQLVLTENGTIVVTRFGYGTTGDVVQVTASGDAKIVQGLKSERRRIGLTVTDYGELFDSWFVRMETGARVGAIGRLSLEGSEDEVITGLQKPVGVLAMGRELYVSDQDLGQILKAPIADPASYSVLATMDAPDLLAAGPDGSLFTGAGGSLFQVFDSGETTIVESGFQQVRGVAYDPTNHRVFVADHDATEDDGVSHKLHILPVD